MSELVSRMRRFGTTIFAEMSALAVEHDAVNLGQGFPDTSGPQAVLDAAITAITEGRNQYPPGPGVPQLRNAVAAHQRHWYGLEWDVDSEVLVTAGATEALAAAILALCEPGDELIAFEPFYDAYDADAALAQATLVPVRLEWPEFALDVDRLASAITPNTRAILVNTPHNPTGHVFSRTELEQIAELAIAHDLVVITDEVYEHLAFDEHRHIPMASLPGMRDRTVTISSGGKTFATTGWKVGWVTGSAELVSAVTAVKQWLTYVNAGPLQEGIAVGLALPDAEFAAICEQLRAGRDLLVPALADAGFAVAPVNGGYFAVADAAPLGVTDAAQLCRELPQRIGVAAVPLSAFYRDASGAESLVRFAFCKRPEVLHEAAARLRKL
ncbi:pyridoxal phosphate-dependent aminotransferase [uncultured Gulosibacter sp.]|uniref:pyridoxal phosphate-dependent aminotransferase n=1 Tax=uncultured Gulosibacter sp. TaxID=1339167 RepID=UPI00288C57FF|nr:pyridoxal phosphate-dependent aminotransferase [uncultured Gulosibacter sp.]